jgi:hypothetical protein
VKSSVITAPEAVMIEVDVEVKSSNQMRPNLPLSLRLPGPHTRCAQPCAGARLTELLKPKVPGCIPYISTIRDPIIVRYVRLYTVTRGGGGNEKTKDLRCMSRYDSG